jgi:hypothetical protein
MTEAAMKRRSTTTDGGGDHHHPRSPLFVTIDNHHTYSEAADEENFVLAKTSKEISSFRTIQDSLKKLKIIMRKIHETHVLYVCSENDWQEQIKQYMEETNVFSLIGPMTTTNEETSNHSVQDILKNINHRIIETLDHLFHSLAITHEHYEQMIYSNPTNHPLQVNQLYFIPKLYQVNILHFFFFIINIFYRSLE